MQYKCENCYLAYIDEKYLNEGKCPECGGNVTAHCVKDTPCHCGVPIHETIAFCDVCGHVVCPGCGCHDVEAVSRITGYLNAVEGFNQAKRQELKDRVRYNALSGEMVK